MTALHEAKDQAEKRKAQAQAHAKVKTEEDVQAHAQKLVHAQMQAAQFCDALCCDGANDLNMLVSVLFVSHIALRMLQSLPQAMRLRVR